MEMDAFIDGSRWALPAVDPALFPTTPRDGRYWTSTTAPWLASEAYLGDLAYGALSHADQGTSVFVRCVR
jgi:hypothetical protein